MAGEQNSPLARDLENASRQAVRTRLTRWRSGDEITADKLNESVLAIEQITTKAGSPQQKAGERPINVMMCAETADYDDARVKLRALRPYGEIHDKSIWWGSVLERAKFKNMSIERGALCVPIITAGGREIWFPTGHRPVKALFRQESGDLPDSGSDFPPLWLDEIEGQIIGIYWHKTDSSGTFDLQLRVNDTSVGPVFSETDDEFIDLIDESLGGSYPYDIPFESPYKLTLRSTSTASGVEEFQATVIIV